MDQQWFSSVLRKRRSRLGLYSSAECERMPDNSVVRADIGAADGEGKTALHACALSGNTVVANMLLEVPALPESPVRVSCPHRLSKSPVRVACQSRLSGRRARCLSEPVVRFACPSCWLLNTAAAACDGHGQRACEVCVCVCVCVFCRTWRRGCWTRRRARDTRVRQAMPWLSGHVTVDQPFHG